MRMLWCVPSLLTLMMCAHVTWAAPAGDDKGVKPTIVVQIKPIDEMLADAKAFAKEMATLRSLNGKNAAEIPDWSKQIEPMIEQVLGANWRKAIGTSQPIGAYAILKEPITDSEVVLLLPVPDKDQLLKLMGRFGIETSENKGIYTFTPPNSPTPIYFRVHNGYAYAAPKSEFLDMKKLPDATAVLSGKATNIVSVTAHIDRLPAELKKQLQDGIANLPLPDANDDLEKIQQERAMKLIKDYLSTMMSDATAMTFGLDLDRKSGEVGFDFTLDAKPGSEMAKQIQAITVFSKGRMANLIGRDSAASLVYLIPNYQKQTPEETEKLLTAALNKIEVEEARKIFAPLIKPLTEAIDLDRFDLAMSLNGPDAKSQYTAVAGLIIKNGRQLEKALVEAIKKLPDEQKKPFKLSPNPAAGDKLNYHEITVPEDPNAVKFFGKGPIYVGVANEIVMVGYGPEAKARMEKAMSAKPTTSAQMELVVDMARLMPLLNADRKNKKEAEQIAKAFAGVGPQRFMMMSLSGGSSLKARFSVNAMLIAKVVMVAITVGRSSSAVFEEVGQKIEP